MRDHLWSHDDERLRPVQRDQHNCVCDVCSDQHKVACLNLSNHRASIVLYSVTSFGTDDVNVFRGFRIVVHSQFDSFVVAADSEEDVTSIICRGKLASIVQRN